ncbi:MAG TPA: M13 family metallopeptidase [Pyrinomonadaceae bacterium]|nr:M13 family metallopeptidase [Pyrinomonadaceae bacterium]
MRYINRRFAAALSIALALACAAIAQTANSGFDITRMDTTCEPCKDFYQYANGGWLKDNQIPAAFASWGSFHILAEKNRTALHNILEESAKNTGAARGSVEQKIGAYYASCMDEAKINAEGVKPLAADFARIEKIKNLRDMQHAVALLHNDSVGTLFNFGSIPDLKNSTQVMGSAGQGGLSLPNREYYTKTDERSQQIRDAFVKHVARMFELLGDEPAKAAAAAQTVLTIQTRLAQASRTPVELRDPNAQYNKMTLAQLKELTPNFDWNAYLASRGVPKVADINIAQPEFFKAMNAMLAEVSLADWKTYLRWSLLTDAAQVLPAPFEEENFNFYGRTLTGAKEQLPRWRRCVVSTDAALGEALGQVYVKRTFTPESKARMQQMINNLISAFRARLTRLDWMSDQTRQQALVKLEAFKQKIGYPDTWRDYSRVNIDRVSYLENARRAGTFEIARNINKIGRPVDRTEWAMSPPTVNAYYTPLFNEIVFPAGILQAPFFNPNADDAINYGAIGAVIGHELTHGFDDRGSLFDAQGNLRMWWTPDDRKKFDERAECVASQFSGFEVEKGLNMNGKLVLGESIADLGGLTVAYDAFQKSLEGKPRPGNLDGFTPEQRFFLGWAQVWSTNYRSEAIRQQVLGDPHPIARFRVNGPLSNMASFAAAFSCKQGDPMVRGAAEQCRIW